MEAGSAAIAAAAFGAAKLSAQQTSEVPGAGSDPAAGHYVENTGTTDLVFLEMFKLDKFLEFSLNQWIRRLPPEMVSAHLDLDASAIARIPAEKLGIL